MKILRRVLALLPAVCLQAVWIFVLLLWLAPWAAVLNFVLSVLAFLFVLYLITKREESTYRVLWLLVILTFPLAGALLYLLFGNRRTTRPLKKKLDAERERAGEPQNPNTAPLYDALRAEEPRLAQTFRWVEDVTGFPLYENTGADYYPLGDEMFPHMLEAIRGAQTYIFLEYFIVDTGSLWDELTEALAEKAKQGVDVRVLYDDLGSISTFTKKDAEDLRRKGIWCEAFNPMVFIKGTLNCRSHRKMLVVDGRVAFSGGINLADEYVNRVVKYGHWKDIGFRLTGDAVGNYVRMFAEFWNAFTHDRIPDELLLPPSAPPGTPDGYVLSYYDSPLREDAVSNRLYIELLGQAKRLGSTRLTSCRGTPCWTRSPSRQDAAWTSAFSCPAFRTTSSLSAWHRVIIAFCWRRASSCTSTSRGSSTRRRVWSTGSSVRSVRSIWTTVACSCTSRTIRCSTVRFCSTVCGRISFRRKRFVGN